MPYQVWSVYESHALKIKLGEVSFLFLCSNPKRSQLWKCDFSVPKQSIWSVHNHFSNSLVCSKCITCIFILQSSFWKTQCCLGDITNVFAVCERGWGIECLGFRQPCGVFGILQYWRREIFQPVPGAGPLEVVCFKCVHLVDPEAQSISSQSIVQREAETYEEQGGHRLILLPAGMLCLRTICKSFICGENLFYFSLV